MRHGCHDFIYVYVRLCICPPIDKGKRKLDIGSDFPILPNLSTNIFSSPSAKGELLRSSCVSSVNNYLAPLAVGQEAYVMTRCLSCVRPCVCALTFSLNIFSETTYWILMKFHRNVPAMVLFRIFLNNLIPLKLWLPWQQNLNFF